MTVRAAGGVVLRRSSAGEPEVLLVHRPKYDDWSLPKGKRDHPDETDEDCARREVEEETGLTCQLGPELPSRSYRDRHGQPKVVRYWVMEHCEGTFTPQNEVDDVRWVSPSEAHVLLTYPSDAEIVDAAITTVST